MLCAIKKDGKYSLKADTITKYWKYDYSKWVQPTIASDGIIGGNTFACSSIPANFAGYPCYQAFDGKSNTTWVSSSTGATVLFWYCPKAILIKKLTCVNSSWITGDYEISASNDNTNWTLLISGKNTNATVDASWDIDLSANTNEYKYYKFNGLTSILGSRIGMAELIIDGYTKSILPATKDDYDFTTEEYTFFGFTKKDVLKDSNGDYLYDSNDRLLFIGE